MTCPICGGKLKNKIIFEEIQVDYDHILVKVKAEVCDSCNERYFNKGTADKLIKIKKKAEKSTHGFNIVGKVLKASGNLN